MSALKATVTLLCGDTVGIEVPWAGMRSHHLDSRQRTCKDHRTTYALRVSQGWGIDQKAMRITKVEALGMGSTAVDLPIIARNTVGREGIEIEPIAPLVPAQEPVVVEPDATGDRSWEAQQYLNVWSRSVEDVAEDLHSLADRIARLSAPGHDLRSPGYDFDGAVDDILHAYRSAEGNLALGRIVKAGREASLAQHSDPTPFVQHRKAHTS